MYYYTGTATYLRLLIILAALPVIFLMVYIYRQDAREHEPIGLVLKVMFFGSLSAIAAIFLEKTLLSVVASMVPQNTYAFVIAECFFVIGLSEEGVKLIALKLGTWHNSNFDYSFDGIVYGVASSLGFALLENIMYVVRGGVGVAMIRAVLSVPGHMCFGVFMGTHYSKAKGYAMRRQGSLSSVSMLMALVVPLILHGLFDGILMAGSNFMMISFVIILYIVTFSTIKTQFRQDHRL